MTTTRPACPATHGYGCAPDLHDVGTPGYRALTSLATQRNGDKRGTFVVDGHEVTVVVNARHQGKYNDVRACSSTHPALTRVLRDVGMLTKRGVGRYDLRTPGDTSGYEDRGTVASLAERLTRYALAPVDHS